MNNTEILKNVVDLSMSSVEVSVSSAHILSGTREVQNAAKLFEKGQIQDGVNHYNLLEQASAEVIQSLQSLLQIKSNGNNQIATE